ncbi:MAG: hypothetical protein HPY71_03495 [Firmicutes bacterium]|nr:hypothetical protein [Bacillota bacterium]
MNMVPRDVLLDDALGIHGRILYVVIALNAVEGQCITRIGELMRLTGFRSPNTVRRYLKLLVDRGWVEPIKSDTKYKAINLHRFTNTSQGLPVLRSGDGALAARLR